MSHIAREKLYAFYDGELPERERRQVETHLSGCAECRRVCEEWKKIAGAIFRPVAVQTSEAFVQRVMESLPEEEALPSRSRITFRWLAPAFSLAAAGLALILAWPGGNEVSAEALILANGQDETPALLAFAPQAPGPDELLGLALEEP